GDPPDAGAPSCGNAQAARVALLVRQARSSDVAARHAGHYEDTDAGNPAVLATSFPRQSAPAWTLNVKLLKQFIKAVLAWPPLWRLVTARRWRNRVIVLMYHLVEPDSDQATELTISQFRQQLDWLQRTCRIITPA